MSWWSFGITMTLTAISTDMQVRASKKQAKVANQTAILEAKENRAQAQQAMDVAGENARRKQRENMRHLAAIRSSNAKSGFQMEGTPLAVFGESALQLEREILDMSFQAENRYRALIAGADTAIWEGAQQASALQSQAITAAISGGASAADSGAQVTGYLG